MTGLRSAPTQPPTRGPGESAGAARIDLILERVDALPTLGPIAARVIELGSADGVGMDEVARVIESDPSLAARVLGLCRRSDTGLGDKITTVKRAVVMLGLDAVRSAILAVSVYNALGDDAAAEEPAIDLSADVGVPGDGAGGFDRAGYWRFCIGVACASELIAELEKNRGVAPEEAFLAGLLHGVGKLALDYALPRSYDTVVRLAEKRGESSAAVERDLLGVDHHTAGKRLAQRWKLPPAVQETVWLHDQPSAALAGSASAGLIGVVTGARALCRHLHVGWSGDFSRGGDVARVWRSLGLRCEPDAVARLLHESLAERLRVLGLDKATTPALILESLTSATRHLSRSNAALREDLGRALARTRALDEIASFNAALDGEAGVTQCMAAVCASAARALGVPRAVAAARSCERWRLVEQGPGRDVRVDAPAEPGDEVLALLAALPDGASQAPAGACAWIGEGAGVRVLPLRSRANRAPEGFVFFDGAADGAGIAPLVTAWAHALRNAAQRESAARTSERLVIANRELAQTQARLAEQESMARLGETTAGAAHELNNPLTVISGRAQLLLTRLRDERDRAAAAAIQAAARDIGDLIKSLHLLSSPPKPRLATCSLRTVVQEAIDAARQRVGTDCTTTFDLSKAPESIATDPALLRGALTELIANALDASPRGRATVQAVADPNGRDLELRVIDDGPGLSDKALVHAFDPFFSEKPAGRGHGLGLPRARVMAGALEGEIRLENRPPVQLSQPAKGKPESVAKPGGTRATLVVRLWSPVSVARPKA